jgi:photosystem II stability/assembly factor-like uncharacterized protein
VLLSTDAGQTWTALHVPEGDTLDFRGVQAFDEKTAYVMSSGDGEKSRIYKTVDGGKTWALQYSDKRKSFFLDAIACRDATHCFALSDPVDGKFLLLATTDGAHWSELARDGMPPAIASEGAFAASNSSLLLYGKSEIYFVTGGPKARVFHSEDSGKTWSVAETPILSGKASQGIFSIVRAGDTVVAMGGDYADASRKDKTAAYSSDGGKAWQLADELPAGYRSSLDTYDYGFVAVGPTGAETSHDGSHWKHIDSPELNALTFDAGKGWAVGSRGTVARFVDHTAEENSQ